MNRTSLLLVLCFALSACDGSPPPTACVAPFPNASIAYTFCHDGAASGQATCVWSGGNPPYPVQGAGNCQATADIECVQACPCVPDGLPPGDTFVRTECGDGATASCRIVEVGPGAATVPAWDCTYGGLLCVQGCETK